MTQTIALPRAVAPLAAAAMLVAGCGWTDEWFGDPEEPPLPGERLSVLMLERSIEPDPEAATLSVTLPPPVRNDAWSQAGGTPSHALGHLALAEASRRVWTADIGSGSDSTLRLLAQPVVAGGRVFAMDADAHVAAVSADSGAALWRVDLQPEDERGDAVGGGVALGEGRLFAATGYGEVVAIDPDTGNILWRRWVGGPVRGAPTVADGRVIVLTLDNQTRALAAEDGTPIWEHAGILETAGLLGSVSPAVDRTTVVVPYSSGELVGLRAESGRPVWGDSLAALRRLGSLSGLADIRGLPVIDNGLVFAVGHSGRTVAIDQRTGARVWEQDLGGVDTPWVAGDLLFVLSNDNELVALTRRFGLVRWVTALPRFDDPEDEEDPILWSGPVLAGGRLWLTGSNAVLLAVAPQDGTIVGETDLPGRTLLPPVVADGTLFVVTDSATLAAYR